MLMASYGYSQYLCPFLPLLNDIDKLYHSVTTIYLLFECRISIIGPLKIYTVLAGCTSREFHPHNPVLDHLIYTNDVVSGLSSEATILLGPRQ